MAAILLPAAFYSLETISLASWLTPDAGFAQKPFISRCFPSRWLHGMSWKQESWWSLHRYVFLDIWFPVHFQEDWKGRSHRTKGTLWSEPATTHSRASCLPMLTVLCLSPFWSKYALIVASPAYSPWAPLQRQDEKSQGCDFHCSFIRHNHTLSSHGPGVHSVFTRH